MRIAIVNQHGCNRGDEAAGRAVIESLLNEFPDAQIDVLYKHSGKLPAINGNSRRVTHYPELGHNYDRKKKWKYYVQNILNILFSVFRLKHFFLGDSGKVFKKILESDVVICAPTGPNIGDIYKDKIYLLNLFIPVLYGKDVFMYGSSVGPFQTKWLKFAARFLFNRMKGVCVREEISFDYLNELKLKNKNIHYSIDAAVQRVIDNSDASALYKKAGIPLGRDLVGITPLAYYLYPAGLKNIETQRKIESNLAEVINRITENANVAVVFFPQLYHLPGEQDPTTTDIPIIESIIGKLSRRGSAYVVPGGFDSDEQQSMISKLKFFIAMRYHSIIFSTKMAIPCIGICYEHKAMGFMKKAGIDNLSVKIEEFLVNKKVVDDKIGYVDENYFKIKDGIEGKLPFLRELSSRGTKIISSSLLSGLNTL